MKRISLSILAAASALLCLFAATHDFAPDAVFKGSSLAGLRTLGSASWRAENGEITGSPTGPDGGWLVLDESYQDLQFYTDFHCAAECNAGVLLRAGKTSTGGLKGVYISLRPGDTDSYEIELSSDGKELSRTKLIRATAQFSRVATGPSSNGNAQVPGFARLAPTLSDYQAQQADAAQAAGAGGGAGRGPGRGGRGTPGGPSLVANDWNSFEVIVDMDMVSTTLNGRRAFGNTATIDHMMGYGPVALHVAGVGDVKFRDLAYQDLNIKHEPAEKVSSHFRMQRLSDFFYSWGAAAGDINHDGIPDVVAGPFYFLGPDYTERHEFTAARTYAPSAFPEGMTYFAYDYTGDGWNDLLVTDSRPIYLFVNPKVPNRRWERYNVIPDASSEIEVFGDIDGDGKPEVLFVDRTPP